LDLFTHALSSIVLARATQNFLPRRGLAILLIAGLAPDLDSLAYFPGASAYLRFHATLLHALPSAFVVALIVTFIFLAIDRRTSRRDELEGRAHLHFVPAMLTALAGIALHLALDSLTSVGFRPFWPLSEKWLHLDVMPNFEIWTVLLLAAALAIPELAAMVREEIGDRDSKPRGVAPSVTALALLILYMCIRAGLHSQALHLLSSREFPEGAPIAAGAFPTASPFTWRGVVATETSIDEVDVPFLPGETFDPDRGVAHAKPDSSPTLDAAQGTRSAQNFLAYAVFPLAAVQTADTDTPVLFRDVRFEANDKSPNNLAVEIVLGKNLQVEDATTYYNASGRSR
jgi:inner membrane protein